MNEFDKFSKNKFNFKNIVKVLLIVGNLFLLGFIIYYIVTPKPGHIIFGILNSEMKAGNYPTKAKIGDNISFYVYVGNELNRDFTFYIDISKGDNDTVLTQSGAINAIFVFNITGISLKPSESWISNKINVSFNQTGSNQLIIIELYEYLSPNSIIFKDILWLRLNITI